VGPKGILGGRQGFIGGPKGNIKNQEKFLKQRSFNRDIWGGLMKTYTPLKLN
jgi:hypothetical protein